MSIIENALDKVRRSVSPPGGVAAASLPLSPDGAGIAFTAQRRIAIDFNMLRAQGELPEAGLERRFADYYREIKRPLIQAMLAPDAHADSRLILITSALPGEGKSFTALNLALSMATERDVSVLLVDADLPKGHLSRTFGLQGTPGLLDALADEAVDVDSLVVGTDIRGLEILPAGRAVEGAAELVASARMAQIAARLARHPRRLVLFDSAPLLASSEARALKQIPGQILIVTRAGRTPRQALLDAIALIDKTKLHGLVLNDAHASSGDDYYAHYGYSGYGAPSDRARGLVTRFVLTALALASPALAFGQDTPPEGPGAVPAAQAVPGVGSPGAALPGAMVPGTEMPGETSTALAPPPADLTLYGIAAGIGETDNVNLSSTDPKSQTLAATNLDFDLRRTGSRFDASALGTFTDLDYLQGAYSNQILGRFDGLATAKLWSDRLKWVFADDYGEEQTDPFAAVTPVNLQRVNIFTTGPDLTLRPSYSTFVNLDAHYSKITYQTSPFSGHNLLGSAEFGRDLSPLSSLSLVVQAEELRFDNTTVNTDYDRREAYGRYLIQGARTSIDAQLGATQANDVGSSWKTSPLARLRLTRRISESSLLTLAGGREYTDAAGSFSGLSSGAGGGIVVAPVSQTTANYVRNYGSAGWEFQRLRTTVGLTANWEHDAYDFESVFNVTRADIGVNLGRELTPKLALNIIGTADRYEYVNQGYTDKFGTIGGGLIYRPGRWFLIYARYDHSFRRASGVPTALFGQPGYDENRVFVMVGYRPHSDEMEGGAPGFGGPGAP